MKYEDSLSVLNVRGASYDEYGNPVEANENGWVDFLKCFISFNSSAQKVRLNDGEEFIYSYYIICPLRKNLYDYIPKEGDRVRFVKADGTIDAEMEVKGFVTYKKRFLKVWV